MISEIFAKLLADNSRLAKEAILKEEFDNELFKKVLVLALNPYIKFHVRRIPKTFKGLGAITLNEALNKLEALSSRTITGNAAVDYLSDLFDSLALQDGLVLKKIIEKDLKCGVSTSTVNKIWPGLIPTFDIQFASGFEEKKLSNRFALEPKLDGMRVFVMREDGAYSFMSRGGREFETMDHFGPELDRIFNLEGNICIDCEVVSKNFESTVSDIKRKGKNKKENDAKLIVFDMFSMSEFKGEASFSYTYEERRERLETIFFDETSDLVELNDSITWDGEGDPIKWIYSKFVELRANGFEGAIVKDLDAKYVLDRTAAWMKVKPFETADVVITGYFEGTGRNKGRLGGFTFDEIVDGEKVECRVGGGFSDKNRDEFWAIKDEMVGTLIEIEFMEKTAKGRTRHCNFIRVRNYKGEKA